MNIYWLRLVLGLLLLSPLVAHADSVSSLMDTYRQQGGDNFSASGGEALWNKKITDAKSGQERSCTACHTNDLKLAGKHARTGKVIKPMAPSVNPKRLTKTSKIEKWFKRNCKWTLGRECTPQEKGDVLMYIKDK